MASVNKAPLTVAVVCAVAAAGLALYVAGHPYIPADVTVEDGVQSINWGPLLLIFPIFSWIGDAKGAILEVIVIALILVVNRRAWILAVLSALTGAWYVVVSHVIIRPRPTAAQVLRVTEHPNASSFPSGHTMFVITLTTVLMLCLGRRFLPRWAQPAGWVLVLLVVLANAISRVYVGAHWPTDVLEGFLISVAWLSFVISLKWVADRALGKSSSTPIRA
jgi:membrane-associated phospholipid phosphatase